MKDISFMKFFPKIFAFNDIADDANYRQAIAWAVEQGITYGTGDGLFSPDQICSRGQIMTFLYRNLG